MRVMVTGTRTVPLEIAKKMIEEVFDSLEFEPTEVIHGASGGVDWAADEVALDLGIEPERYYAKWGTYGNGAGPIRNKQMVDSDPVLCIALWDHQSKGTKDAMRKAGAADIPVIVVNV